MGTPLDNLPGSQVGQQSAPISKRGTLAGSPYRVNDVLFADIQIQSSKGTPEIIKGVQLEDQNTGIVTPLSSGRQMEAVWPNADAFQRGDNSGLRIKAGPSTPSFQNLAVPANLLGKVDKNALLKGLNGVCLAMNDEKRKLEELSKSLTQREGMVIIQQPFTTKSSGMAIDQSQTGSITQFDKAGNVVAIERGQLQTQVNSVNTRGADRGRNHPTFGGLPAQETFVADAVPKSNVFTPIPTHIPWVTEIVYLFGIVRMLFAVTKITKQGLKDLRDLQRAINSVGEKEKVEAITKLVNGQELTDQDLQTLIGEQAQYTDKDRLNKLKKTERIKALLPVLQDVGVINGTEAGNLQRLVSVEEAELKKKGASLTARNKAFDQIATEAGMKAKAAVENYTKQGTPLDYSRIRGSLADGSKNTMIKPGNAPLQPPLDLRNRPPILGT